jgi:plastocyanin domain-containing protein
MVVLALTLTGCGGAKTTPETRTSDAPSGAIAIALTEEGFVPAEVTVPKDQPVTLVVTRKTDRTCAKELVIKSHGIHQALPLNEPVTITFTPTESGTLRYACGMDMIAGTVVVQ